MLTYAMQVTQLQAAAADGGDSTSSCASPCTAASSCKASKTATLKPSNRPHITVLLLLLLLPQVLAAAATPPPQQQVISHNEQLRKRHPLLHPVPQHPLNTTHRKA
jgi:hypothetical protein